ncbi:MAG: site-specific integrase [Hydrogenoanaerobacterium sp.]
MASIKQKSERKFKITVSNGYHPDGGKIAKAKTITVPDSVQRRVIYQYVAHAAEEFEREVKLGYSEDGEMTFEEYATRWLGRQTKYALGTLGGYRKALEKVYPIIGHIKLNKLRPISLENMCAELRKREWQGKPIKETTVQKFLTTVSAVLRDAKKNEIIQKNPARMIDLPVVEKVVQAIPTDEQAKEFLCCLLNEPEHFKIFYLFAMFTGCRRGELCALKWSDIIIEDGVTTMVVSRSRSSLPGCGIVESKTKNGKARVLIPDEAMMSILQTYYFYKVQQADENGFALGEYLFTDDDGKLLHPDTFTKHLRKLYDRNGFPKEFHLHTLRHYFVSTMLHSGVDKQTVADLAGHGDTSFLERTYCHPQTILKQKAAVALSNTIFGGSAYVDEQGREQIIRIA